MPINVSQAICADTAEKIIIQREAAGNYVNGIWVSSGIVTNIKALASVQHPMPKQLEILPEGMRATEIKLFIANKKIYTVEEDSSTPPDKIVYNGKTYKCFSIGDWFNYGHNAVLGVKQ